jgi:hypothetical protein
MKGVNAVYNGKIVDRHKFRAFIYNSDGQKKLVESWDEYEKHMQTGLWFSKKKEADAMNELKNAAEKEAEIVVQKPKKQRVKKEMKSQELSEDKEEECIQEGFIEEVPDNEVYEVKDDFLPNGV